MSVLMTLRGLESRMQSVFQADLYNYTSSVRKVKGTAVWRRGTQFGTVKHMKKGHTALGQSRPYSKGSCPSTSQFEGFLYLAVDLQWWPYSACNTWGGGTCFRGQPCHCFCTNVLHDLTAMAEFSVPVKFLSCYCYVTAFLVCRLMSYVSCSILSSYTAC